MSDYVTVEMADNEAMAGLIKQRLEQGGIPCIEAAASRDPASRQTITRPPRQ